MARLRIKNAIVASCWTYFTNTKITYDKIVHNVLIIRPNKTYRSNTSDFYYKLQNVSAVQFSHHQEDVGYTKRTQNDVQTYNTYIYYVLYFIVKDYCAMSICCVWSDIWHVVEKCTSGRFHTKYLK